MECAACAPVERAAAVVVVVTAVAMKHRILHTRTHTHSHIWATRAAPTHTVNVDDDLFPKQLKCGPKRAP